VFYRLLSTQETTRSVADFIEDQRLSIADAGALIREILSAWDLRQIRVLPRKHDAPRV